MFSARRLVTILGTLGCAFGVGYVMQTYATGSRRAVEAEGVQIASAEAVADIAVATMDMPAPVPEAMSGRDGPDIVSETMTLELPALPAAPPPPVHLPDAPVTLASLADAGGAVLAADLPAEQPAPGFGCEIAFSAQPVAAAMVKLTLAAPCLPDERFTLHHGGMMVAQATDEAGKAELTVPALSEAAVFIATFASRASAVARAEVGTLEYYDRAVVQWRGPEGLQIHALEYGADYGDAGHVWAGSARTMADAARGEGGFVTRLGDPALFEPMLAEVYTFPSGTALADGDVSLTIEAQVTTANCGTDLEAQALQKSGAQRMHVRELSLTMPDCGAVGDYLVLKNLLDDLTIARN